MAPPRMACDGARNLNAAPSLADKHAVWQEDGQFGGMLYLHEVADSFVLQSVQRGGVRLRQGRNSQRDRSRYQAERERTGSVRCGRGLDASSQYAASCALRL